MLITAGLEFECYAVESGRAPIPGRNPTKLIIISMTKKSM